MKRSRPFLALILAAVGMYIATTVPTTTEGHILIIVGVVLAYLGGFIYGMD